MISSGCKIFEGIDGFCCFGSTAGLASESLEEPKLFSDEGFESVIVFEDSDDEDDEESMYGF